MERIQKVGGTIALPPQLAKDKRTRERRPIDRAMDGQAVQILHQIL